MNLIRHSFWVVLAVAVTGGISSMVLRAADFPGPTNVPPLMVTFGGQEVRTRLTWEQDRKPQLKRYFLEKMYGVRPSFADDPSLEFEDDLPECESMDGAAVRKCIRISYRGPCGTGSFRVLAFVPRTDRPVPAFVFLCNRNPKVNIDPERRRRSAFWPAEEIVSRGYAAVAFFTEEVAPETYNPATAFLSGVFTAYETPEMRTDESWGTLSAWAWGASRVLDWMRTDPAFDMKHVAVIGHSRAGKAALLAGATDERFALTCSNCSGCGGMKLASIDLPKSEYYASFLDSRVIYWFCGRFQRDFVNHDRHVDKIEALGGAWPYPDAPLKVDQHELAALIAPRLLAVASASKDEWAGPLGEFHSARLASPAWELYGEKGLCAESFPAPMQPVQEGCVSYHLRDGVHDLTSYDWKVYMDFADGHGWCAARKALNVNERNKK